MQRLDYRNPRGGLGAAPSPLAGEGGGRGVVRFDLSSLNAPPSLSLPRKGGGNGAERAPKTPTFFPSRDIAKLTFALSLSVASASPSSAQDNFYAGKTIQVVIGFDVGGGYDLYARTVARYWSRHIPGNPLMVPQNMPGAGTRTAGNYLYNVAPKDGTAIGTLVQSTPVDQALGEPGIRFDSAKFNWLGNPIVDNLVTLSWATSGLATIEDVKTKGGLFCGSTGAGPTSVFPRVINQLLGTQIKIIAGYPGQSSTIIAMERGEVNCIGGTTWASVKATMRPILDARKVNVLVQWGTNDDTDISAYAKRKVPLIQDYGQNDLDRRVLIFIGSGAAFGRPLLAPPGVPPERIALLRRAFDATMRDPEFLAETSRLSMEIKPVAGEELQRLAVDVAQAPPAALARAKELIGATR